MLVSPSASTTLKFKADEDTSMNHTTLKFKADGDTTMNQPL
jgi:hypothetical protein